MSNDCKIKQYLHCQSLQCTYPHASDNRSACLGFLEHCNKNRNNPICVALTEESAFTVHAVGICHLRCKLYQCRYHLTVTIPQMSFD